MKRYIVAVIVTIMCWGRSPQAQPVIPRFENIGVNDGLSQSSVYSIFQDRQGYMWFGTADGLNRYDGSSIQVYKLHHSQAANSNFIRGNICEDAKNNIWFTNETGIFCYNRRFDQLELQQRFNNGDQAIAAYINSNQHLWMIHPVGGIARYDLNTRQYRKFPFPFKVYLDNFISARFLVDSSQHILLAMEKNKGVVRFNTQTQQYEHALMGQTVFAFCLFGDQYCISADGKLVWLNQSLQVTKSVPFIASRPEVRMMLPDRSNRLWLASIDSGLTSYSFSSKEFIRYQHSSTRPRSLPFDLSTSLFIDRTNNLWIGSDGGGVSKLDLKPPRFNRLPLNEGDYPFLKDYFTRCFYEDEQRRIWFGTNNSGLNILDTRDGSLVNYQEAPGKPGTLPGNIVSALLNDRDHNMWVAGSLGLSIFHEKEKYFQSIPISGLIYPLNRHNVFVYHIIQLASGQLVAATQWGLISIKKNKTGFQAKHFRDASGACAMTSMAQMEDGSIWVTAPINGLKHFKVEDNGFTELETLFKGIDLRSVHRDESDPQLIWVCSGIGLIRLNSVTKEYKVYDEKDGMANSYVYGVLEDEQHNMWMSTNGGLVFFNRKNGSFDNYSVNDGLQSNEFNTSAFHKGASGQFYFGGVNGFNWFGSMYGTPESYQPGVAITSIAVNFSPYHYDTSFYRNTTITLPHHQNSISFRFAALDFTMPQANQIRFKLDGWDKNWIISHEMNMHYTNLSPGTYTLYYQACNSNGQWSEERSLHIHIMAPFWRTWWFYTMLGLALVVLIVYITKAIAQQKLRAQILELERQHELEQERQRIGREMHDDIGAGLTQITLMSEAARRNASPKKELDDIAVTSRQLVSSMNEIIWSLNADNNSMDHLLAYLREQLHKLLEPAGISYQLIFPAIIPEIILHNSQRRNILLTIREMTHNAIKHSRATDISIEIRMIEKELQVAVSDNGIGFDTDAGFSGNGLRNIRQRVRELGGTLEIKSGNGCGCRFSYRIPLNSHFAGDEPE